MKSITDFPPDDLALRIKLPMFREETRERLIEWGVAQPGSMPWLLKRTARYWDVLPLVTPTPAPWAAHDAHHRAIDATAALDLLRWRVEALDDKGAVSHLETVAEHQVQLRSAECGLRSGEAQPA